MTATKHFEYELEHHYPGADRQRFWDMFVDHEAWSRSDLLPGQMAVIEPGDGHPLGTGAVRSVTTGRMVITEDIVEARAPELFRYEARDGSMPVLDFGGELRLEQQPDGVLARYRGGFNPKYPGTGRPLRFVLRLAQRTALRRLGRAYAEHTTPSVSR